MSELPESDEFTLLVAAAGKGSRLGKGPKAFLRLGDKSLLEWVVTIGHSCVQNVIVAVPEGCIAQAKRELAGFPGVQILEGGRSRQETYRILVDSCRTPYVIIRDVARPLASAALIEQVAEAATAHGAAGAFQAIDTPIAIVNERFVHGSLTRENTHTPSNPQAYKTALLRQSLHLAAERGIEAQTLWELVLQQGTDIYIIDGEEQNQKITTQRDWDVMTKVTFPLWLAANIE